MRCWALILVALFAACGNGVPPPAPPAVAIPALPRHCQSPVMPPQPPPAPRTVAAIARWGNQAYASALINAVRLRACAENRSDLYHTTDRRPLP